MPDEPTEGATLAYREQFERDVDDLAQRIVSAVAPAPHPHAGGILLLCATRLIGHLSGHLDNLRAANGRSRHGAEASIHEAYRLFDAGRPRMGDARDLEEYFSDTAGLVSDDNEGRRMPPRRKSVADLMRAWREHADMTTAEAGARLNLSRRTIEDIELGRSRADDELARIALEKLSTDAKNTR